MRVLMVDNYESFTYNLVLTPDGAAMLATCLTAVVGADREAS